jgi:ATP-dependent DNA helicase RecG
LPEKYLQLQDFDKIGKKKAEVLASFGIENASDVLLNFPFRYLSRTSSVSVSEIISRFKIQEETLFGSGFDVDHFNLKIQSEYTVIGKIIRKEMKRISRFKEFLVLHLSDGSGKNVKINFWHYAKFFMKKYQLGMTISASGRVNFDKYGLKMDHPDIEIIGENETEFAREDEILPVYRLSEDLTKAGINQKLLRNLVKNILEQSKTNFAETLSNSILKNNNFQNINETISSLHFPKSKEILAKSRERMKFEEIFYYQLSIWSSRKKSDENFDSIKINPKSKTARIIYDNLPFRLTKDQKNVLNEIARDFESGKAMNRLLQGDVGSGKTITALLAMLMAIDSGQQTLLIAPTEILAYQHFESFSNILSGTGIEVCLLVGKMKKSERDPLLRKIRDGKFNIIIGTHAVIQKDLRYKNLGFVVIDEQHRFGVSQRAELLRLASESIENDGNNDIKSQIMPHCLVMSATPIPRTLEMTVYGDLDVSIIKTMPKGRKNIITKISYDSKLKEVLEFVRKEIQSGRQAFFVYPAVDSKKSAEMKSATEWHENISNYFPEFKCGLLHGKLKPEEKEFLMEKFKQGKYNILIATTVVEVGIDIPNASVMLIENAERFGLAGLHQLRGRIGRGEHQSYCILMTKDNFQFMVRKKLVETEERHIAVTRLKTMEATLDGFKIAEIDLSLRGPGDLVGTRQSGLPPFLFIDLVQDLEIIQSAKKWAINILEADPNLSLKENIVIKEKLDKLNNQEKSHFNIA